MDRYDRQSRFAPIGTGGQRRLRESRVVLVGCGALGSVQAELLVRAGIGALRIIDRDVVELSNLQRQSLFTEADAIEGAPKAEAARLHLQTINREVEVEASVADLTFRNVEGLLAGTHLILDATDNFETRLLVNEYAVREGLPWIYGACVGAYGLSMTIRPSVTPCLACLLDSLPGDGALGSCDAAGVIGPAVHLVAAIQTTEAMKLLTGDIASLHGTLLAIDLWRNTHQQIRLGTSADYPECPCCKGRHFPRLSGDIGGEPAVLCGRDAVQLPSAGDTRPDLAALEAALSPLGRVRRSPFLLRFEIGAEMLSVFADGRVIVHGTCDPARARILRSRYLGG